MATAGGPTALDIITEALQILGVYAQGENVSAADSASALFTLNALVDGWGAERLMCYTVTRETFNTIANKQRYTIGPATGADWVLSYRPISFSQIYQTLPGSDPAVELEVVIVTDAQWASIPIKDLASNVLQYAYPTGDYPNQAILFWPVPQVASPVNLWIPQQIGKPAALSSQIVGPPGYQEAFTYELAIKLAAKFGAPIPQFLPQAYTEAKSKLKSTNLPFLDVQCDSALIDRPQKGGRAAYLAFYTGE